MPEESFYVEGVQIAKRGIAMDIQRFLPKLLEIKFVESFKNQSAEVEKDNKTEKKKGKQKAKPKTKAKAKSKPKTKSSAKTKNKQN